MLSASAGCQSAYCNRGSIYYLSQSAYHGPMSRTRLRLDVKKNQTTFAACPGTARPGRSVVEDVAQIAGRFGADAEGLRRVVTDR